MADPSNHSKVVHGGVRQHITTRLYILSNNKQEGDIAIVIEAFYIRTLVSAPLGTGMNIPLQSMKDIAKISHLFVTR
ncbi:MAG: hypothetical protein MMC33_005017 [Icmadophila ericetorum]|nr:hypothetical protein [Icmadophila ericetorum]